jgi:eukaryotic-like serine/threonine-protein kinase
MIGKTVGSYTITATLGEGGMGTVYRATDTRLGREVAIKFSGEKFSERFDREARAIAALNHSNICTLYDVGPDYLVMELIEGEAPKGPMPVAQVLDIARQIADALKAAHEKGIVHRDLKPANIRITPDGKVKVLDFGLARLDNPSQTSMENSPTLMSVGTTQAGLILGTAAYMSPEQARGKAPSQGPYASVDQWRRTAALAARRQGALFRRPRRRHDGSRNKTGFHVQRRNPTPVVPYPRRGHRL